MNLPPHKHRTPSPTNSLMTKLLAWVLGYTSTQPHIVTTPRTKLATWPRTVRLRKNFQFFFLEVKDYTHLPCVHRNGETWNTWPQKKGGNEKKRANPPVEKRESLDRLVLLSLQPQLVCAPNYYTTLTTRSTDGYGGLPIKYAITYLAAANANPPLRTPATPIFVVLVTHRVLLLPPPNHSTKLFPMIFYGSHTCVRNP